MLVLLVLVVGSVLWRFRDGCWINGFCRSFLTVSVFTVILSEVLSHFESLNTKTVYHAWLVLMFVEIGLLIRSSNGCMGVLSMMSSRKWQSSGIAQVGLIIGLLIPTAITSLLVLPTTADCMAYHFTRVEHWIQNHSFSHFPTSDYQIHYSQPFAEMFYVQLRACAGSDRLACFSSWIGSVIVLAGLVKIIDEPPLPKSNRFHAAVWFLTMPTLIMHQTTAKNDILAAAFCVIAWSEGRQIIANGAKPGILPHFFFGASIGLAILTKATVIFFLLPILVMMLFRRLYQTDVRGVMYGLSSLLICLCFVGPHSYRNVVTFGSPLGPDREYEGVAYKNGETTARGIISNVFKNCALHLTTPWQKSNHILYGVSSRIHRLIGEDANNPLLNWDGRMFELYPLRFMDANDGQPLHFLCLSICVLLVFRIKCLSPVAWQSLIATSTGFVLFCTVLRWQTWHPRLHLQFFVLATPFLVEVLSRFPRWRWTLCVVLVISAMPWMLFTEGRPLLGQDSVLRVSADHRLLRLVDSDGECRAMAQALLSSKSPRVAVVWSGRAMDYPLYYVLRQAANGNSLPVIQHLFVGVENLTQSSGSLAQERVVPDWPIIVMDGDESALARLPVEVLNRRSQKFGRAICFWPEERSLSFPSQEI
jgi:hypothetical protein